MRCLSVGGHLLAAVAVVAGADVAQGSNPAVNHLESRQSGSPSNSPPANQFLRRVGGTVSVLGDRIYYDGGSVSQVDWVVDGRLSNPTNTTLSIDLSKSWSPENVSISEIRRPDIPAMQYQSAITDEVNGCIYVWGGFSKFNIPVPSPREFYKLCDNVWGPAETSSIDEFRQIAPVAFSASASTKEAGFIFGGRAYRNTAVDGTENSKKYLSYNYTTHAWNYHDIPDDFAINPTMWGARAIFVPNFGPNGLIFLLGGITGIETDGQAYLPFRSTVRFMDPVTNEWYKQEATAPDGFPGVRHEHCIAGVAGENNTYDIYMFGGANNDEKSAYNSVHVLSLPSFTWSLVGRVPKSQVREGNGCAVVGKSQFLTWGGIDWGSELEQVSSPDPFPQGLGILDLNALEWKDEYRADAAAYTAHSRIVAERASPTSWTSDEVSGFFNANENSPVNSETPLPDKSDSGSSPPIGAIAGGVVGGVVLVAAAAGLWFFLRRRRAKTAASTQQPSAAAATTQYELVSGAGEHKYPAELHEQHQPAEMAGYYGKEPPRPVHEMDGGYNNGGYNNNNNYR